MQLASKTLSLIALGLCATLVHAGGTVRVAVNPQPLPPRMAVNPQPLPPRMAVNPQPLPPRTAINPQPLPPHDASSVKVRAGGDPPTVVD